MDNYMFGFEGQNKNTLGLINDKVNTLRQVKQFLRGSGYTDTTIWMHYLEAN